MTVTVKHSKTNTISDWTQAQLDEQIALGNFPAGTTLANIVLPSDWNNDHTLTGVGTMAEQNANNVAITGGTINNTSIGATTASTGKFTSVTTPSVTATTTDLTLSAISTGAVNLNTAGGTVFKLSDNGSMTSYWEAFGGTTTNIISATGSATNVGGLYRTKGSGGHQFTTAGSNSNTQLNIAHTASAVNYVQVTGAATGNRPAISSQGSDTNIGLSFDVKGGPNIFFRSYDGVNNQLKIAGTNASVNNHVISGGAATIAPSLSVEGTDTNISMAFQPKGTGAIDLAAGSSGVNISNGGTVTAITRTSTGSGYTSFPTVTIAPPTTAGGVQATATIQQMGASNVNSIANGGTGYTVGNVLTLVGGTPVGSGATYTVTGVSGGVITAVSALNFASYTVLPPAPTSVTGGTGSGATLNVGYYLAFAQPVLTAAGSGYIEQPTVSFSGGGGSGASAIASVGSGTIFRSINNLSSLYTPFGEAFRIQSDQSAPQNGYVAIIGSSSSSNGSHIYTSAGNLYVSAAGSGGINFYTNGTGNTRQLLVAHTASAVNYVQVTGAATTGQPIVSAQGSDTNVSFRVRSKGTGFISLENGGGASQLIVLSGGNANYTTVTGTNAGSAPIFGVAGSDTNIDLALTPKGTGRVQFGTYTGTILTPTGYVEIVDSGGTVRRLLVG